MKKKPKFELYVPLKGQIQFAMNRCFELFLFAVKDLQTQAEIISTIYWQGVQDGYQAGKRIKKEEFKDGGGI